MWEREGVEKGVSGISFKGLIMKQTTPLILVGLIFNEPILKQITPKVVWFANLLKNSNFDWL
jgi:hypothetical protein